MDDARTLEARLLEAQRKNDCAGCWTSCRGPIETLMYGTGWTENVTDYYQLTRDVPLGARF